MFLVLAAPAICESDKDCLKGQAKCVRRECHCTDKYAFGDGKTKCESKYKFSEKRLFQKGPIFFIHKCFAF